MLKAAIVYDSRTGHTAKAAAYIGEGIQKVARIEVRSFSIYELDADLFQQAALLIF